MPQPQVKVNRKGALRVESGHPWIFRGDITDTGEAAAGDAVTVADPRGRILGTAHYSAASQIALRMLSSRVEAIDRPFLMNRLKVAAGFRSRVVADSDAFRVVYSEADQLPGLIVDKYADHLVIQALDQGMDRLTADLVSCLDEQFAPKVIVGRYDAAVRKLEALPQEKKVLLGDPPEPIQVRMNGLSLSVDLVGGQKTGVFLDQRENYAAAARWARGKALDCFTCTGGFALHMASGCEWVEAVDSSTSALAIAETNARNNAITNIHFREANAFDLLAGHAAANRKFQTIVLDPPAFAKSRANLEGAIRGYKEINLRALQLLEPAGILITCSCSHHMSEAALLEAVAEAALDARRRLRVLERRTQALDHPILLTVPETHYLKCLILQATN